MITLTAITNAVQFIFQDSKYYLYGNGTIDVPLNSLSLVIDNSGAATFRKAASNDIFVSAPLAEFGMSKAEIEAFYKENMVGSTGGSGGGVTSGEVETMIDAALTDYYDIDEVDAAISGATDDMATQTWVGNQGYITEDAISGKADTSALTAVNDSLTAHTNNSNIHVTAGDKLYWDGKSDFSGSYNDLTDKPTIPTVPTDVSAFNNDAGYITSGDAQSQIDSSISGKQDTLVSGTNIKTINNQSLLGSGNIDIQGGGGKAVSGGTNISIATGETADTINCKIPYSDVVNSNTDIILGKDMPSVSDYNRVYYGKKIASRANASFGYSIGIGVPPSSSSSDYNELYGSQSIGIGAFKIGNGSQYANFVNGCVAIGYGAKTRISNAVAIGNGTEASGTTKTNINNQLKIDTSNQVYIYNKDNTEMICLQDQLGGGGSYTAGEGISIENDEISTSYSGYPSENTEIVSEFTNFEGQCLILGCEATQGEANFETDNHGWQIIFDFDTQTYNDNGDSSWQNYFTLEWDDNENAFMLTTLQTIDYMNNNLSCVRFKDLAPVILYSGTTTDGINGALDEINEAEQVTARALIDLNDRFGGMKLVKLSQQEYEDLTEKDSMTLYIIINE